MKKLPLNIKGRPQATKGGVKDSGSAQQPRATNNELWITECRARVPSLHRTWTRWPPNEMFGVEMEAVSKKIGSGQGEESISASVLISFLISVCFKLKLIKILIFNKQYRV